MYDEKITYKELLEIKNDLIKKYDVLMMKYFKLYKKAKGDKRKRREAITWLYSWAFEDGRLKGFCDFVNAVYDYLCKKKNSQN